MKKLVKEKAEKISRKMVEKHPKDLTDLFGNQGVYALYTNNGKELYYVGKAKDLKRRLSQHLRSKNIALWDYFSIYTISKSDYISEIESLLIQIANPKGNKITPKGKSESQLLKQLQLRFKKHQKKEYEEMFNFKKDKIERKTSKPSRKLRKLQGYFKYPKILWATYKGLDHKASLLRSGKIKYKNKIYDSPSGAAKAVIDSGTANGWNFWYVQKDKQWIKLSNLK